MPLIVAGTKHKDLRLHRDWQQEKTINIPMGFLERVNSRIEEGTSILLGNARSLAGFLAISGCSYRLAFGSVWMKLSFVFKLFTAPLLTVWSLSGYFNAISWAVLSSSAWLFALGFSVPSSLLLGMHGPLGPAVT